MKYFFTTLFFIGNFINLFSQNIDSLQNLLKKNIPDTQKIRICLDITWNLMYQYPDSATFFARQALDLSEKNDLKFEKADAFNALGTIYAIKTNYIKSMDYEQKAIETIQKLLKKQPDNQKLVKKLGIYYLNLANAYYHSSLYQKAIENYQKALLIGEKTNFTNLIANSLTSMGSTYRDMKMYDLSLKYYKKGLQFAQKTGVSFYISQALNNLGNFYIDINTDSAEFYYNRAKKILQNDENFYYLIPTLINIIDIKTKKNQFDSVKFFLSEVKILLQQIEYPEALIKYYYFKGKFFENKNNYDSALTNYNYALQLAQKYNFPTLMLDNIKAISDIYILKNDYKNAYEAFVNAKIIEDSIYNIEKNKALAEAEIKFEVAKKEILIQQLKKDKKYTRRIMFLLAGLVLLLITVLILGIYLFAQKQKNSRLKHQLIEEEKIRLDEELNYKSRQLTTQALIMMQKNKTLNSILNSLTQIAKNADSDIKKDINALKRKLRSTIKSENDWNLFKHYFEDVNPSFFKKIQEITPNITPAELKLCALIKLRFSIKETAEILNLSPDSVKTARYHLRKKLNLSKGQDLSDFLNSL